MTVIGNQKVLLENQLVLLSTLRVMLSKLWETPYGNGLDFQMTRVDARILETRKVLETPTCS